MANTYVIDVIRRFQTDNFVVIVDAIEDEGIDLSWDESGETASALESGRYMAFCARARVLYQGEEIASDYLGGCIYESAAAFMDHRECGKQNRELAARGESSRCGSYFTDMIHSVCADARKYIAAAQQIHVRAIAA